MHAFPSRLTRIAALLAAFSPLPVLAKAVTTAAPAPAPVKVEPVVQKVEVKASTDSYNPRKDDTATKIVVNREELLKYGDTNVADALKRLPGITVSGRGGRGSSIMMRGLGAGYTQILVDGDRPPVGFSLDDLAPDAIERIEIVRAATAEFSTQSIAGTVNIVLKRAIRTAQRELKVNGGGNGPTVLSTGASIQTSDRIGKLGYTLSAFLNRGRFKSDNTSTEVKTDTNEAVEQQFDRRRNSASRYQSFNLSPRLLYTLPNGDTLSSQSSVNIGGYTSRSGLEVLGLLGMPVNHANLSQRSNSRNYSGSTDINWAHKFAGGAKIDMRLAVQGARSRSDSEQLGGATAVSPRTFEERRQSRGANTSYSTRGKYSAPVAAGHSLVAGWDLGVTESDSERNHQRFEAVNPQPFRPYETTSGTTTRGAAYVQDEWNVTPHWSVYAGLRWEGIENEISGNLFAASRSRLSVWTPVFQTLVKLPSTKGGQLRFALTRTFKAPTVGSLTPYRFLSANNSEFEPDYVGNPELDPETAIGFDTSYEHYWGEGAMFSVSGTVREISGYNRSNTIRGADGRWVAKEINDGKAHARGLEVELKFPMKAWMKVALDLDVRFNLARNWSSVDAIPGPNNRLAMQTPLSGTIGIDYRKGPMTVGTSTSYRRSGGISSSANESADEASMTATDAYFLWKFSPKLQVRASVSDVFPTIADSHSEFVSSNGTVRRIYRNRSYTQGRLSVDMKF